MPIIIESHRIMGVDTREVPEGTVLESRGYPASEFGESWSAVSRGGESLAVTAPGGRIEIYLADEPFGGRSFGVPVDGDANAKFDGSTEEEWPCNDCGVMVPVGQELCGKCQIAEDRRNGE